MLARFFQSKAFAILTILLTLLVLWYVMAVKLNTPWQLGVYERANVTEWTTSQFINDTLNQDRPVLPSAHQVFSEMYETIFKKNISSKRSLIYHAWITLSATLLGFAIGTFFGILIAIGITHNRALDRSLMPWVIASQTIPILAIAPMIIVVLNAIGLSGLLPKALISTYLSFFPIVVGMVKGFRSPNNIYLDLMATYNASKIQIFLKLLWPSSLPYLFTSMKVAISIALVGAIVGELPTGAVAGLGARLLSGSYYGQTVQIWSALFMAAILAASLVMIIGLIERQVTKNMGAVKT